MQRDLEEDDVRDDGPVATAMVQTRDTEAVLTVTAVGSEWRPRSRDTASSLPSKTPDDMRVINVTALILAFGSKSSNSPAWLLFSLTNGTS